MTREDIIQMAREIEAEGFAPVSRHPEVMRLCEKVAADAIAKEREACAQFIEDEYVRQFENPWREDLAAAIRARGQA